MNRKLLWIVALLSLVSLFCLVSCSLMAPGAETGLVEETGETDESGLPMDTTLGGTGENDTASGTETEAVTAIPRYDYITAEVASHVQLDSADYKGITLTVPTSLKVTEADVQTYIRSNILFSRRTAVNGTTMVRDQALKLGDDAYIYYKGFVDGVAFEGGSNWDSEAPQQLGLGSGQFIPGFEESLVGIFPNQTSKESPAEIHVTFPEEYNEDLAGKDAVFHVVVEYAVQYTIPEYTRDFLVNTMKYEPKQEFYASDRAFFEEFEAYILEFLTSQRAQNLENAKIDALWNHLTAKAVCSDLVPEEISYYCDAYKAELDYYFEYYSSMGNEEFNRLYPNMDAFAPIYLGLAAGADWQTEITKKAELMVQRDMIIHAIGEREGLETVTEEEYQAQIDYWVNYYYGYMTEAEIVQNMGEVFLRESAFSQKMDQWLLDQVTFTYADGTPVVTMTDKEA